MIKNGNIILSQSITKDLGLYVIDDQLEKVDSCYKKVYHKHIAEDYPHSQTESMEGGVVFETLVLGGGAKGQSQTELSLKNNGGKRVLQERIEIQAQRMIGYMYAKCVDFDMLNAQVPLISKYKPHVWLRGEMDIFPTRVDGNLAIIDLKSTKDIYSDFFTITPPRVYSCVNSCWGDADKVAKNQPLFYHYIARNFESTGLDTHVRFNPQSEAKYRHIFNQNNDYSDIEFWYFVAGIGVPKLERQLKTHQYNMDSRRWKVFENLVDTSVAEIREAINSNFKPNRKEHLCKSCAMKDVCK